MVRSYSVKYKKKSAALVDADKIDAFKKAILDSTEAKSIEVKEAGTVVSVEAEEDQFPAVMTAVVNEFRKIDDKSEVSYSFALNM